MTLEWLPLPSDRVKSLNVCLDGVTLAAGLPYQALQNEYLNVLTSWRRTIAQFIQYLY